MKVFENFSFANPEAGLLIIFLITIYFWFAKQERSFNALKDKALSPLMLKLRKATDTKPLSRSLPLVMLGLALIILAWMRPRFGYEIIDTTYNGVDIAIAVDVSDSMLAEDMNPNRLGVAKRKIQDILNETAQDRIALISAAGTAFIESPLTLDKSSIEQLSSALKPDLAPIKGSSLSSAIQAAHKAFSRANAINKSGRSSALVLLTDGEYDKDDFEYSAELLKQYSIVPYAIIFGTAEGAPVPTGKGFKRDSSGKLVISRANVEDITKLFTNFKGRVVKTDPSNRDVNEIVTKGINRDLKKDTINYQNTKNWKEYFQIPLILGLLMIVYTWRSPLKVVLKLLFLAVLLSHIDEVLADSAKELESANNSMQDGNFKSALEELDYIKPQDESHTSTMLRGNILYRIGKFAEAEKEFAKSASLAKTPSDKSQSLYNRGNALLQMGKIKEARTDYESALKDSPSDAEIDNNLKYVKKLLEDPPPPPEEKEEEKEPEDKKDPKDNQDNKDNKDKKPEKKDPSDDDGQKSPENSSGDNQPEQKPDKPAPEQSDSNNDPENKEGEKEINKGNKQEQEEKSNSANGGADQKPENLEGSTATDMKESLSDQSLSQLNSIEEDTTSRQKYRFQKALTELEQENKVKPRRDW